MGVIIGLAVYTWIGFLFISLIQEELELEHSESVMFVFVWPVLMYRYLKRKLKSVDQKLEEKNEV